MAFEIITKDNEVSDVNLVQVASVEQKEDRQILTLQYLITQIAVLEAQKTSLDAEITRFKALKDSVSAEAAKVKLIKKEKVIEP